MTPPQGPRRPLVGEGANVVRPYPPASGGPRLVVPPAAATARRSSGGPVVPSNVTVPMVRTVSAKPPLPPSMMHVPCTRCGHPNCDVRVVGGPCRCVLHARCVPLVAPAKGSEGRLTSCPACRRTGATGLTMFAMDFGAVDEARERAAAAKRSPLPPPQMPPTPFNARHPGQQPHRPPHAPHAPASSSSPSMVGSTPGANAQRGRKRKVSTDCDAASASSSSTGISASTAPIDSSERRTGRWTPEETAYCDALIAKFESGSLPIPEGTKLNDFLASMFRSKQSRLTKKMKNAKLSSRTFARTTGHLADPSDARRFGDLERDFLRSIQDAVERAEMAFHMSREWREHFSTCCVDLGQILDADAWLSSVEEMDRRSSLAKDAARMARRKLMMGYALVTDGSNPPPGVFIEKTESDKKACETAASDPNSGSPGATPSQDKVATEALEVLNLLKTTERPFDLGCGTASSTSTSSSSAPNGDGSATEGGTTKASKKEMQRMMDSNRGLQRAAPFLSRIITYLQRTGVPFEHVDAWVPSFVSSSESGKESGQEDKGGTVDQTCRLCYAGGATADVQIPLDGTSPAQPLGDEEQFHLLAFGDYSSKFSFDVGCGLPGRVYHTGVPTWEQGVQNAPSHHFERCGGAVQWGIQTVVGIPVPSPNVGRIVVTLYSRHDRPKDQELVGRLCEEFKKLLPSPKWKLVVDMADPTPSALSQQQPSINATTTAASDDASTLSTDDPKARERAQIDELVSLLGENMPSDPSSPFMSSFMSLRLLLLRPTRSTEDDELVRTMLGSYVSYSSGGSNSRSRSDLAIMLARDYTFLMQQRTGGLQQPHVPSPPLLPVSTASRSQPPSHPGATAMRPPLPHPAAHAFVPPASHPPQLPAPPSPAHAPQHKGSPGNGPAAPFAIKNGAGLAPGFTFYGVGPMADDMDFHASPALSPIPGSPNAIHDSISIVSN